MKRMSKEKLEQQGILKTGQADVASQEEAKEADQVGKTHGRRESVEDLKANDAKADELQKAMAAAQLNAEMRMREASNREERFALQAVDKIQSLVGDSYEVLEYAALKRDSWYLAFIAGEFDGIPGYDDAQWKLIQRYIVSEHEKARQAEDEENRRRLQQIKEEITQKIAKLKEDFAEESGAHSGIADIISDDAPPCYVHFQLFLDDLRVKLENEEFADLDKFVWPGKDSSRGKSTFRLMEIRYPHISGIKRKLKSGVGPFDKGFVQLVDVNQEHLTILLGVVGGARELKKIKLDSLFGSIEGVSLRFVDIPSEQVPEFTNFLILDTPPKVRTAVKLINDLSGDEGGVNLQDESIGYQRNYDPFIKKSVAQHEADRASFYSSGVSTSRDVRANQQILWRTANELYKHVAGTGSNVSDSGDKNEQEKKLESLGSVLGRRLVVLQQSLQDANETRQLSSVSEDELKMYDRQIKQVIAHVQLILGEIKKVNVEKYKSMLEVKTFKEVTQMCVQLVPDFKDWETRYPDW